MSLKPPHSFPWLSIVSTLWDMICLYTPIYFWPLLFHWFNLYIPLFSNLKCGYTPKIYFLTFRFHFAFTCTFMLREYPFFYLNLLTLNWRLQTMCRTSSQTLHVCNQIPFHVSLLHGKKYDSYDPDYGGIQGPGLVFTTHCSMVSALIPDLRRILSVCWICMTLSKTKAPPSLNLHSREKQTNNTVSGSYNGGKLEQHKGNRYCGIGDTVT